MTELLAKNLPRVARKTNLGYNQTMTTRREKLKAIQEAYAKWEESVKFTSMTGASDEDESRIMAEIQTILQGNKPQSEQHPLSLVHGGYCTHFSWLERR